MAENEKAAGRSRHRSPNYPAINLADAAERVATLYRNDGKAGSSKESAALHLGYDKLHSHASKVLSALKKFGLVEYQGNRVLITKAGLDVAVRPSDDPKRVSAIQEAVQAPSIYKELIDEYASKGTLPSDASLRSELLAEKGFNANAVDGFIKDFRRSLEFAGIDDIKLLDSRQNEPNESGQNAPKVGDYVQWESQGVLQFPEPLRVRAISDDGGWAFVEGSTTGMPVDQLIAKEPPVKDQAKTPPTMPLHVGEQVTPVRDSHARLNMSGSRPGVREELTSIPEGNVLFSWPDPISEESGEELKEWLRLVGRKIDRSVKKSGDSE